MIGLTLQRSTSGVPWRIEPVAVQNRNLRENCWCRRAECEDFRLRATDPTIQSRLDSGALDQEAFVDIIEQP